MLNDVLQTEISVDKLSAEGQFQQFAKITRCLLEYQEDGEKWHDVHPILREVREFQDAVNATKSP